MSSKVRYSSIPRDHDRNFFSRLEPATSSLRSQSSCSTQNSTTLPGRGLQSKVPNLYTDQDRTNNRPTRSTTVRRQSQSCKGERYTNMSATGSKSSSLPVHCGGETSIMSPADVSPEDLASQLTLLDLPVFKSITPDELLSCSWNKKHKMDVAPHIVAFTRRFNHVSFWTVQEILKFDDPRSRADIMSHFIKLAKRLHELNNLHSEFAVLSALQGASIYRLNKTWSLLSRHTKQTFDKLKDLFSDKDNWCKLRDHMNNTALKHIPCIPYLGLYLTDLMMVDIAHPSHGGLEPHQRQLKMNNILRIVSELQQSAYTSLTVLQPVQTYLSSVRYIDELQKFIEDDQFKISLKLEPSTISPPVSSSSSKESVRNQSDQQQQQQPQHQHEQLPQEFPVQLSPICLSPSRRSGCLPKSGRSFVPGHRKSRSEGGNILFGCSGGGGGGGGGITSPDMPHPQTTLGRKGMKVSSMDSLDNEKTRSLLDGSLLEEPTPGACTQSPVYSPDYEREALTPPDPLAINSMQPGSVRTFQGYIQRKTLIKDGRRPIVASWQRYWLELWDTSLVYYLPKPLSKCRERRDFRSEPCKLRSTMGWIVMVPQPNNQLHATDQESFQLADPVMKNVYRFRGDRKDRNLWVYHLTRASKGITAQCLPTNLISFE